MGAALSVSVALAGCGGDPPGPMTFSEINQQILQPSCAKFSSCHSVSGAGSAGNLDLATNPYAALVGVASDQTKAAAEGLVRVKPGDPEKSFLYIKLAMPTPSNDYGDRMPQNNPAIPRSQLEGIKAWITAGAAND